MNIARATTPDGLCVLTFDRPASSANIFDRETLEELEAHIAALEQDRGVRGVVLASAKPKMTALIWLSWKIVRLKMPSAGGSASLARSRMWV